MLCISTIRELTVRTQQTTNKHVTRSSGWPGVASSTPGAAESGPPGQRATAVGAPLHHCARTAFGFRSRIAHAQLCRAHRPPLVAAFPRRLTPSLRTASWSVAISLVARAARGYRGHARRPLAAHAPRARASTSPGTADGRELGALKHGSLASGYRRWRANRGDIGRRA